MTMKQIIAIIALAFLLAGCTGVTSNINNDPFCTQMKSEVDSHFGSGFSLAGGELAGPGKGSCIYERSSGAAFSVVLVHMSSESLGGKSTAEMRAELEEMGIYRLAAEKKMVEGTGYVYSYSAGAYEGVPAQHVILYKGQTLSQITVLADSDAGFYPESTLLDMAMKVSENS